MKKPKPVVKEYLHAFYDKNHLNFGLGMFFLILEVPRNLLLSWILGAVLDTVITADLTRLMKLIFLGLGIAFIGTFLNLAMRKARTEFLKRGLKQYKSLAFSKLTQKSISAFTRENTGRYLSVLTNDVNTLEENYLNNVFYIVLLSIQFFCTLIFMLWYSFIMTVATILLCVLPMIGMMVFSGEMKCREKAVSDGNERFVAKLKDLLSGFAVLKSFKAEKEAGKLFNESNEEIETLKFRRRWWKGLLESVNYYFIAVLMQLGIFFIGAYLAIRGDITLGTTIVFVQVCNYLMQGVQDVPQNLIARKAAKGLIEKLAKVNEENVEQKGESILPILSNNIIFDHVSFGYDANTPILKDLSLTLEAGKKYALVGASGSGKSTLMNLIMGAYDNYQGSITIDGKELKKINADSLYDVISLIGQNVFIFDDTIQQNITMFREFSPERLQDAMERSGLIGLINERGGTYQCGENGAGLSGGERQRISIARALLRGTPVLLLDEVTAALDNQTAFTVTDSILHLDGLTRLVVTHRLEEKLLEQYDKIFVLKDGHIIENGTFDNLMQQNGYFRALYTVAQ